MLKQALLGEFMHEVENTRKLLSMIPDSALEYRPQPHLWSVAQLASHIAEVYNWYDGTFNQDFMDMSTYKYDKGDIIAQRSVKINYPLRINDAINEVSVCYKGLIEDIGKQILSGQHINAAKQDETLASYSLWLDEEDYQINWNLEAEAIKRFIDAVGFPYSGAATYIEQQKMRVNEAEVLPDLLIENRKPGKIIFIQNGKPVVVCGKGLLKIISLTDDQSTQEMLPLKRFRIRFT